MKGEYKPFSKEKTMFDIIPFATDLYIYKMFVYLFLKLIEICKALLASHNQWWDLKHKKVSIESFLPRWNGDRCDKKQKYTA